ncbi:MAG: DUF1697 domain-containing protein [Candidatus Saccharimonas sp.]
MQYVALLRGINVGGNSKVEMKRLKEVFEHADMEDVRTYINSGNVLFTHVQADTHTLTTTLEADIEKEFGFSVPVLVKSHQELRQAVEAIENDWRNDSTMKCDVLFAWESLATDTLIAQLKPREGIDEVRTAPGAVIWKVDRENATRSGLLKIMGTPAYRQVTVRNCNTARKLLAMMEETK